jgi:hypothetical protein
MAGRPPPPARRRRDVRPCRPRGAAWTTPSRPHCRSSRSFCVGRLAVHVRDESSRKSDRETVTVEETVHAVHAREDADGSRRKNRRKSVEEAETLIRKRSKVRWLRNASPFSRRECLSRMQETASPSGRTKECHFLARLVRKMK